MSDWMTISLRGILDTTFAGEWGDNPYPYNARVLRATDITDDMRVNLEGGALRFISKLKLEAKKLVVGDIILEGSGGSIEKPVGRVAYFDAITSTNDDFIVSNFFRTLRPNKEVVHPKFLYWLLNWFYKQPALKAMQQQTTGIINLKLQQYLDTLYCLPMCKTEQIKIAEVLDTLDLQIRETETIIDKLQQVKQGLLYDLLTRGVDEDGKLRPSIYDDKSHYFDSETILGFIPVMWSVVTLGDLLSDIDSGWSPNCPEVKPAQGEWGVLKVSSVTGDSYKDIESKVLPPNLAPRPAIEVKSGDVILTRANGNPNLVAKTVYIEETQEKLMLSDKLLRLIPNEKILPRLLVELMGCMTTRSQVLTFSSGSSGQKNISQKQLRDILVVKIPENEQLIIEKQLNSCGRRIDDEITQLNKLKQQKSGLMDDLLTGKKRVTDLLKQKQAS
jgi:type I restriction enzyme S subunit